MRQRLHGGHTHECSEVQVGDANLIAVGFEVRADQHTGFAIEGLHALESSGPLSVAYRMRDGLADARLVVYENGGHVPMEELPGETSADAEAFLHR